jgi:hypothetical protein
MISRRMKSSLAVSHLRDERRNFPQETAARIGLDCINRVTPRARGRADAAQGQGERGPAQYGVRHASLRCNARVTPCTCVSATKHHAPSTDGACDAYR